MRILKHKKYTYILGRVPSRGRAMRGFATLRKPQQGLWFTRERAKFTWLFWLRQHSFMYCSYVAPLLSLTQATASLRYRLFVAYFIVSILSSCTPSNHTTHPQAGIYTNGLLIAYNPPTQELTAYYDLRALHGDSCALYFVGRFYGRNSNMVAWHPQIGRRREILFGEYQTAPSGQQVGFALVKPLNRCATIAQNMQWGGNYTFSLIQAHPQWRFLRTIRNPNAKLYHSPNPADSTGSTIPAEHLVKVIGDTIDWFEVEYQSTTDSTLYKGWLKAKDMKGFPG